jgi:hypothetical protein
MCKIWVLAVIAWAVAAHAGAPSSTSGTGKQVLVLREGDVTAHAEADTTMGPYYTVSYELPAGLRIEDLERALLELSVDVRAKSRESYVNDAPVLEAYALTAPYAGVMDARILDLTSRAMRPVAVGDGRRVVLDLTNIVRAHLDGSRPNHGFIIGSLTGMREGDFRLRSGSLDLSTVARVHIYVRGE